MLPKKEIIKKGDQITAIFKGVLSICNEDILRFHPRVRPLLKEIESKGWKWNFWNTRGKAKVIVNLKKAEFSLHYSPPRYWEEPEEEGYYYLQLNLGDKQPAIYEILEVKGLEICIGRTWSVRIDPFKEVITYISDPFWGGIGKEKPEKLSEAREIYEIVRWFLSKGYQLKDKYEVKHYKKLVDCFEKRYQFPLELDITVEDAEKVPNYEKLQKQLTEFFREKGMLVEIKDKRRFLEKPLP